MNARFLLPLVVVGCTQDASITAIKTPEPSGEDTSAPPVEEVEILPPEEPEECPDRIYSASVASVDEDCLVEPPTWRYTPVIEWKMDAFVEYPDAVEAITTPVVGHFTDDDGDGTLGSAGDIPDVVAMFMDGVGVNECGNATQRGVIRLVSGDGSEVFWSVGDVVVEGTPLRIAPGSVPAIGDIDNDGEPEIVVALYEGRGDRTATAAALDRHGELEWVSDVVMSTHATGYNTNSFALMPGLWDVDQDGMVEITFGSRVLNGEDGTDAMPDADFDKWDKVVIDLDKDGVQELVSPVAIYEQDGTKRCQLAFPSGEFKFASIGDVDGDDLGEIVVTGDHHVTLYTPDCRMEWREFLQDAGQGGGATIADYDGDGSPEIGVASSGFYYVFDSDGSVLWEHAVRDYSSNATSSSVYDFEGDGYAEVVYAGEANLWIMSGVDGTTRMVDSTHSSCTGWEYPITVDVDGDGHVEIVVLDAYGLRVVGDADNGWVSGRDVWNQHHFSILNVNDDLSIPTYNEPNWPEYNSFRSADLRSNDGLGALLLDAVPYKVDVCEVECEQGRVSVVVQGANEGLADASSGFDLAFYAQDDAGERTLLHHIPGASLLRSGFTTEGYAVELAMSDLPTGTLVVVADDDGTGAGAIDECDETNNELVLEGLCSDD